MVSVTNAPERRLDHKHRQSLQEIDIHGAPGNQIPSRLTSLGQIDGRITSSIAKGLKSSVIKPWCTTEQFSSMVADSDVKKSSIHGNTRTLLATYLISSSSQYPDFINTKEIEMRWNNTIFPIISDQGIITSFKDSEEKRRREDKRREESVEGGK